MAVSKTQNERPAITALIDAVNMAEPIVAQNVQNIATLTQGLADEAEARAQAVQGVQNQIGEGIFSPSFTITQGFQQSDVVIRNMNAAIDDINQWQDRFRLGLTSNITVEAGGSTPGTIDFETSFGIDAKVAVFPVCVGAGEDFTNLACQLISATYSGFSYNIVNTDTNSHTIAVGYVAVKVN